MNVICIAKWKSHVGVMYSVTLFTVQPSITYCIRVFFSFFFCFNIFNATMRLSQCQNRFSYATSIQSIWGFGHWTVNTTSRTHPHFIVEDQKTNDKQIIMNCSRCNVKCLRRHNTPWLGLSFGFSTYYLYILLSNIIQQWANVFRFVVFVLVSMWAWEWEWDDGKLETATVHH